MSFLDTTYRVHHAANTKAMEIMRMTADGQIPLEEVNAEAQESVFLAAKDQALYALTAQWMQMAGRMAGAINAPLYA